MTTALRRAESVTVEGFDAFVGAQADTALFELVEGVIVMMTNPTEVHEQIAGNVGAPLKLAMDARGCRTYHTLRGRESFSTRRSRLPTNSAMGTSGPSIFFLVSFASGRGSRHRHLPPPG